MNRIEMCKMMFEASCSAEPKVHVTLTNEQATFRAKSTMAFEFVEMELEDRARLRNLLMELGGLPLAAQATNRTRRRGRMAISKN